MASRFSGALVVGGLILGLAGVSAVVSAAPELPIRGASVTEFDYLVSIDLPAAASERGVAAPPPPQAEPEPTPGPGATPPLKESAEPEPRATPDPEPRPRPSVGPTPPARPAPSSEASP